MIYWLEKAGYDVSYASCFDIERYYHEGIFSTNVFKSLLSIGHDEYWTGDMRQAFTTARDHGINHCL